MQVSKFLRRESAGRFGGLPLSCGDVPLFAPDPQDKRWRDSHCEASGLLNRLAQRGGQQHAPDGLWISLIRALERGVPREFTPVFAKHSRSFSLIDSLAIGVDRMQRSFGPMQKKGRKGEHEREGN